MRRTSTTAVPLEATTSGSSLAFVFRTLPWTTIDERFARASTLSSWARLVAAADRHTNATTDGSRRVQFIVPSWVCRRSESRGERPLPNSREGPPIRQNYRR
jgi:hypothetical protein